MKPGLLDALVKQNIGEIRKNNLMAFNEKGQLILFKDALLNYDDLKILIDNNDGIISHIINTNMHWSPADRRDYTDYKEKVDSHITDRVIHVTQMDKDSWSSKETEEGAQLKANVVKELLDIHAADLDVHVRKIEKDRWNNTYTREEISNLMAKNKANTDWKDAVDTYEDLYTTYPNAESGWICTVLDTNITYIFSINVLDDGPNGDGTIKSMWIRAFTNSVPMATENNSGQISKELYIKIINIEDNANNYIHPDNINCRHVTDAEKKLWSNKASKDLATIFSPGLISSSDKEKIDTMEKYANFYEHPTKHEPSIIAQDKNNRFVTDLQIATWNDKPTGGIASEENDGQMSREMFVKLFEIEEKANRYIHPLKHSSTDVAQDILHRFVTDSQIASWDAKEDKLQSQYRADKALEFAKEFTTVEINKCIGLAPGVLNTFEELAKALNNDPDFATNITLQLSNKADKSTYESHVRDYSTHLNALDRLKFETIELNANYYVHPDYHPATMISTDTNNRFITDVERTEWNAKANGNLATEALPGQMSPSMVRKLNSITTTGMVMSDWNEVDENAGSFIRNKPTSMLAHGGNSETVNSYTALELVNSRKGSTFVIGSSAHGYSIKDVDFLCDGIKDAEIINTAIASIVEKGGSIYFREGVYSIEQPITLFKSNVILKASGGVTLETTFDNAQASMVISGDNCEVKGIYFKNKNSGGTSIAMIGNFNKIHNCTFTIGIGVYLSSCNFCEVCNNIFNIGKTAIMCTVNTAKSYGNKINNNTIIQYGVLGINLNSNSTLVNSNNTVSGNIIQDCYSGIKLTNDIQSHNTMNNIISDNSIMRGNGAASDYLYEQHTIRIEKGQYNIINGNMCKGRSPVDDTVSQNTHNIISENNII